MGGSRQCFGMGKGQVCVFSQDKIEAQLIWYLDPKNTDPDVAEDNPEKPE